MRECCALLANAGQGKRIAMPMKRELYPPDWDEIAFFVKDSADWVCQSCGLVCRRPGEPFDTHRRTLTVAHIWPENHAPDAEVVCVAALCSRCHLRFDAARKAMKRRPQLRLELA